MIAAHLDIFIFKVDENTYSFKEQIYSEYSEYRRVKQLWHGHNLHIPASLVTR